MSLKRISLYVISLITLVINVIFTTPASVPVLRAASTNAPILLIVNTSAPNKFGAYLGEILRAEGLNAFDQVELDTVTTAQLGQYDLAILAQTPLSSSQASMFSTYVSNGGALLAMRPDALIAGLFGLSTSPGTLSNGYLQIINSAAYNGSIPGLGLTSETLQIHGDADQYTPAAGAVMLAQLYSNATSRTPYPAVSAANNGSGQAVAFTYDLASSVAYTRQGNPDNANLDVDGDALIRTIDLFQTVGGGEPWIDRNKIPIPQADEQQRLFARLVQQMIGRLHPMPQLWYFPGTAKTMLILTSDAHWNSITDYTNLIADTNNHQGQITMYLSARSVLNGNSWDWPSNANLKTWLTQGNTVGIHPWRLSGSTLVAGFKNVDGWFASTYSVPRSNTVRIHQLQWQGWTDSADLEAALNVGMDFSYYHWGPWLQKPDGTWPHGYITGSGLPMKFVRADGTLTSVYQQLTEMADDQLFTGLNGIEGLTGSQVISLSQSLIDASLAGNYSALTDIHHVDSYSTNPQQSIWLAGDIDYARSKDVPVWNADRWLSFTQARHDANYTNISWNPGSRVLNFNIAMTATTGLMPTTMLPLSYEGGPLQSVTVDNKVSTTSVQDIKSVKVAFVSIPAGNHSVSVTYGASTVTPTATSMPGAAPTGTLTPLTAPTNTPTPAAAAATCPCSIWKPAVTPAQAATTDGRPIEVGVKFRSDVAGTITGLRFYKGTANTGIHVGQLWSNTGSLLASATFTNETASGWQEVAFSSPVTIQAHTTYIASYFSNSGYFAINNRYFLNGVDNAPLHALASGVDGPNGVYQYDTSGFPTIGSNHNYWVDIVFTPSGLQSQAPTLTGASTPTPTPTPGAALTNPPTAWVLIIFVLVVIIIILVIAVVLLSRGRKQ